jgi:hypothetical protein
MKIFRLLAPFLFNKRKKKERMIILIPSACCHFEPIISNSVCGIKWFLFVGLLGFDIIMNFYGVYNFAKISLELEV